MGASSHADVLMALGQPRGEGKMRIRQLPDAREVLLYEYTKSDGRNVELEILLVLLREGVYDGHLWFGSSDRLKRQGFALYPEGVTAGAFPPIEALEGEFVRGSTSGREVADALGASAATCS